MLIYEDAKSIDVSASLLNCTKHINPC